MKMTDSKALDYRAQKEVQMKDLIERDAKTGSGMIVPVKTEAGIVNCELFFPKQDPKSRKPIVFVFHGGGFVLGWPQQENQYNIRLANQLDALIVNIDYPLAPESKFPLPVKACVQTVEKILEQASMWNADPGQFVCMGHSAGGYLALCTVLELERKGIRAKGLVLDYPVVNVPSLLSSAYEKDRLQDYAHWFTDGTDLQHPLMILDQQDLERLPKTMIIIAGLDPMADDQQEFAMKLDPEKCQVVLYETCGHGFTHDWFSEFDASQAQTAWIQTTDFIREVLQKG